MYGRPSPVAMALAPMVLPVPAGPRSRKLRMGMALLLVAWAWRQMLTTSGGIMYHSGSSGTSERSKALSVRVSSSTYLPTKSAWSITGPAALISLCPVRAKMVNSPAITLVGVNAPESSCVREMRMRLPDLSMFTLTCAGQPSSFMRL